MSAPDVHYTRFRLNPAEVPLADDDPSDADDLVLAYDAVAEDFDPETATTVA